MTSQSVTPRSIPQAATATLRHLPLVELLVDTKTELLELATRAGLQVLAAMLEEDRTHLCGPRYQHQAARTATRAGTVASEVVLGGRKVAIRRPRVRDAHGEVSLPTFAQMAATDPLDRRIVEQMLVGVATRQYARSLEPLGSAVSTRGTSKSAVSRRFVVQTRAQLAHWQTTPLDGLVLAGLSLDGVHVGEHCLVVALGIDETGGKHALGLWEGSTENATVCQSLLSNLASRGLRTDRSLLVILDGSKALLKAVRDTFGAAAVLQRCQIHKARNILEHLPERSRAWAKTVLARAYRHDDRTAAKRLLVDLARRLEREHPSAAESVREGLDETLTILRFDIGRVLRASLSSTNSAESLISRARHLKRNVKRWRDGQMVVRWAAASVLEATRGFRRLKGFKDMPKLVTALRVRDQQLGLGRAQSEKVA